MRTMKHLAIAAMTATALALAGCGGGGSSPPQAATEMQPTPYQVALAAIMEAETAAAAQMVVDDLDADAVTGSELQLLNMAVAQRTTALADAAADEARQMLVAAAACTDATAECRDAHNDLVAALQADVNALAGDEDATNAQQAAAQMALEEAEAARDTVVMALAEIDRSTATGMAVATAEDAARMLEADRSAGTIAAAMAAIEAAEEAVGDSDAYDDRIAAAKMAVARAEERNAVDTAVMGAEAAATGLADEAGEAAVMAAQEAVNTAKMAIEDAEHLTDAEKTAQTAKVTAAQGTVTVAKNANDEAARLAEAEAERKAQEEAAAKAKEMAAAGKALKGALGSDPLDHLDRSTNAGGSVLTTTLVIDQTQGSLAADPPAVTLRAGTSSESLGKWSGRDYAHTNRGTGVSNSAFVYTNQETAKTYLLATRYATAGNIPASGGAYTPGTGGKGTLALAATTADSKIVADMFPTTGTKTFTATDPATEILVQGTYHGAAGTYRCPGSGTCTAEKTSTGISLSTDWVFAHVANAMVSVDDSAYLYFGWWLTKDKNDKPTAASAFHGERGDVEGGGTLVDVTTITGSATYSGQAAGKFAISDPVDGGDAGHFTADASLSAKFSGAGAGVAGTIDNFMANGQSVPWSVALNNNTLAGDTVGAEPARNFVAGGVISSAPDYTTATRGVDDSKTTVWSIDGTAAPASGTWSGQMYDEALAPSSVDDGNNVPTSITGVFQSHFGSTHTMVGAFGATAD